MPALKTMSRKFLNSCMLDSERERNAERSRQIEAQLKADKIKRASEVGILLLGGPKSGKWKITNQMRKNYGKGYTKDERCGFRPVIYEALIKVFRDVLELVMLSGRLFDDVETEVWISCGGREGCSVLFAGWVGLSVGGILRVWTLEQWKEWAEKD